MDETPKLQTRFRPDQISPRAWIAPTAVVLGDVTIHEDVSIWYQAVIRGDAAAIEIGAGTNVQDLCMLHADPGYPCRLGNRVTVGHGAIVHGATVEDGCMIGMQAVIMNGARIGAGSLVGVGAVVTQGSEIPAGSLVLGTPGRVARPLRPSDVALLEHAADHYIAAARQYAEQEDGS